MRHLFSLFVLFIVKVLARTFYRVESSWLHRPDKDPWEGIRLVVFLNHTSLYEPLFIGALPWRVLWRLASNLVVPAADITINRPLVGRFFRSLAPGVIPITRKRDDSWSHFVDHINEGSLVIILPEGRMKRATGLDKSGNPMSVRGGIADILKIVDNGTMVIAYSGGLHHVQIPGQAVPNLFKKIELNLERLDIQEYLKQLENRDEKNFKSKVICDLNERMEKYCPPEIAPGSGDIHY